MINTCSKCPNRGTVKNLSLEQCEKQRKGLCEELIIRCKSCEVILNSMKTSPNIQNEQKVDINLRSVYGITSTGGGLAALNFFLFFDEFSSTGVPKKFQYIYKAHLASG